MKGKMETFWVFPKELCVNGLVSETELKEIAYQYSQVKVLNVEPGDFHIRTGSAGMCMPWIGGVKISISQTIPISAERSCFPQDSGIELDERSIVWGVLFHEIGHGVLGHVQAIQENTWTGKQPDTVEEFLDTLTEKQRPICEKMIKRTEDEARAWALCEFLKRKDELK